MKNANSFDKIATSYYNSVPDIPQKYINLLTRTFAVRKEDNVLDLGCGAGDLTLELAKKSSHMTGIDSSKTMIKMAQEKDKDKKVNWIHSSVEDFDFGKEKYNLVFTYEAFHLFHHREELIRRVSDSLKRDGFLAIGWAMYAFDYPLKSTIEEVFAHYGRPWDDWGAWTCPDFSKLVKESNVGLSDVHTKKIVVKAQTSTDKIIDYFFSVSKTASLTDNEKKNIFKDLKERIERIYPTGESIGYNEHSIAYCMKI